MKFIKSAMLALILIMAFSVGVVAKEDTHYAAVEQLLILTKQDQMLKQVSPQMKQLVLQQLQQMDISPQQSPVVEKYFNQIIDAINSEMSWDKIKEDIIGIYMSVYTEQEVRQLIVFYKTPVGQKTIENMPFLMQQSLEIGQKYMQNAMPKIEEITEQMMKEIMENQ